MTIIQRPFREAADLQRIAALVHQFPEQHIHVIDLPYRLCSWAFDDPENARLWFQGDTLAGWVVMQSPFWTIDIACHPDAEQELYPAMLEWAKQRAAALVGSDYERPEWFVNVFRRQAARRAALEQAGFAGQSDVGEDSWSQVLLARDASTLLPETSIAPGFTIRPLAGEGEVEAYVALQRAVFESKNMTPAWRARTLLRPEYVPQVDLVAVSPAGELAGFCIGWFDPLGWFIQPGHGGQPGGQIEPMGVSEAHRKAGLGKALLVECARRLHQLGAQRVYVETDAFRGPALALYESVGFRTIEDILVYRIE